MTIRQEFQLVGFFYILTVLYWIAIGFMGAYWVLYFRSLGLDFSDISLIFIMYPLASVAAEVPTGAVADVFGRKVSVLLSYLVTGLSFVGILLSGSQLTLLVSFWLLAGISFTMESGALDAWFVDTVKHKGQAEHLHRLLGRWGSASSVGFVIGPILGGVLVNYGLDKPFWACAGLMLGLSAYVLIFGREECFERRQVDIRRGFTDALKTGREGLRHMFRHPVLIVLSAVVTLAAFANTISFNSYPPHVVQVGMPESYLGYALGIAAFISVFSLNYSHKIVRLIGSNRRSLMLFCFLLGGAIVAIGLVRNLPVLFVCLVAYSSFYELSGSSAPAYQELFNKHVPTGIRATVLSVNQLNMNVGQILGWIAFGLLSDHLGLQTGIIVGGALIMVASFWYLRARDRGGVKVPSGP